MAGTHQNGVTEAMKSQHQLESVARALRVLDSFTHETPEHRLTDLSELTGMSKTQVLRIASSLEAGGYLARDSDSKRYRLGVRLLQLGSVVRDHLDVRRLGHRYLETLVEQTHESARLVLADDPLPLCVDLLQSPHGVRLHARIGQRMPWHAGASGPAILAFLPEAERARILLREPLKKFTETTKTDAAELRETLEQIRLRGYYLNDDGNLMVDSRGVAAPFFDEDGNVLGAIGVGVPSSRWHPDSVPRHTAAVIEAAQGLSSELGYQPPGRC